MTYANRMYDCHKHGPQAGDHCPQCVVHCHMLLPSRLPVPQEAVGYVTEDKKPTGPLSENQIWGKNAGESAGEEVCPKTGKPHSYGIPATRRQCSACGKLRPLPVPEPVSPEGADVVEPATGGKTAWCLNCELYRKTYTLNGKIYCQACTNFLHTAAPPPATELASRMAPAATNETGKQTAIDISNLRFYARMARENEWQIPGFHWNVIEQTLNFIADRMSSRKSDYGNTPCPYTFPDGAYCGADIGHNPPHKRSVNFTTGDQHEQ